MKLFSIDNFTQSDSLFREGRDNGYTEAVEAGVYLSEQYVAHNFGKSLTVYGKNFEVDTKHKYEDLNTAFQIALFRYVYQDDNFDEKCFSKLRTNSHKLKTAQRERYYEIITAVQSTITPAITIAFTSTFNDVHNIAWGDTAEYLVESNEILIPQKSAEGVRFQTEQHLHNDAYTVQTENLYIGFSTDWYKIATGKADFGAMFFKAAQGFASYFALVAYNQLEAFAAQVPASYRGTGFTDNVIDDIVSAVEGANGGARASLVGCLKPLREIVPNNDFFKMAMGEEWFKAGYIGVRAGNPVVKIDNLINPETMNSNTSAGQPDFLLSNDKIFVMPMVGKKPIKTVFEGSMYDVNLSSIETSDKAERATMTYKAGIQYIPEMHMGLITRD